MCLTWFIGAIIYLAIVSVTTYNGGIESVFQLPIAGVVSMLSIAAAGVAGFPLQSPRIVQIWHGSRTGNLLACGFIILGFVLLVYAFSGDRLMERVGDGEVYRTSKSVLGPIGYLVLMFGLTNWPDSKFAPKERENPAQGCPPRAHPG